MRIVGSRYALAIAFSLGMSGVAIAEVEPAQLTECMVSASGKAEEKVFEELVLALEQADNAKTSETVKKAEAMAASVQKLARRACSSLLKDLPTEVYRIGIRRYMDAMGAQTRARIKAAKK